MAATPHPPRPPHVQVQVVLSTEGRPLDAVIELWQGPDNTPCSMRVYVENGQTRPFSAVIETPRGPNTVAIRNIGQAPRTHARTHSHSTSSSSSSSNWTTTSTSYSVHTLQTARLYLRRDSPPHCLAAYLPT